MFGDMPSHGFYLRHVRGIELSNVEIEVLKPDMRPMVVMNDVEDADLFRLKAPRAPEVPAMVMNNVRNVSVSGSRPLAADTHLDHADQSKL